MEREVNAVGDFEGLVELYRPQAEFANSIAAVYWDSKRNCYSDNRGHSFDFRLDDSFLRLHFVEEDGGLVEPRYACCELWEHQGGFKFKPVKDEAEVAGKVVRAFYIQKPLEHMGEPEKIGGVTTRRPVPEHRGGWVLPAYVAHFKRLGAQAVIQFPAKAVARHYEKVGFKPTEEEGYVIYEF